MFTNMRVFEIQPFSNFNFLVHFSWSWFRVDSSFHLSSIIQDFRFHLSLRWDSPCAPPEILHSPCHKHRDKVCPSGKCIWLLCLFQALQKWKNVYQTLQQNNHTATSNKYMLLQKYNMLEGLRDMTLYLLQMQSGIWSSTPISALTV